MEKERIKAEKKRLKEEEELETQMRHDNFRESREKRQKEKEASYEGITISILTRTPCLDSERKNLEENNFDLQSTVASLSFPFVIA